MFPQRGHLPQAALLGLSQPLRHLLLQPHGQVRLQLDPLALVPGLVVKEGEARARFPGRRAPGDRKPTDRHPPHMPKGQRTRLLSRGLKEDPSPPGATRSSHTTHVAHTSQEGRGQKNLHVAKRKVGQDDETSHVSEAAQGLTLSGRPAEGTVPSS